MDLLQGKRGSPKSRSPSPKTVTVQGRFSVSQINTPSPVADDDITEQVPFVTVTPLRRRSTSWETPSQAKSAVKVLRRSGISRASMKGTSEPEMHNVLETLSLFLTLYPPWKTVPGDVNVVLGV